jgi:hypothetical protein
MKIEIEKKWYKKYRVLINEKEYILQSKAIFFFDKNWRTIKTSKFEEDYYFWMQYYNFNIALDICNDIKLKTTTDKT